MAATYLSLYNVVQTILWSLALILVTIWTPARSDKLDLYICMAQSTMILDIVHVALGLTRGRLLTTTLQILSRLVVVWFAVHDSRAATEPYPWASWCFLLMYSSWAFAEIIRYSYYLKKDKPPQWLKWLRYSAFHLLYPVGVLTGEIPIIYLARTTHDPYDIYWLGYSIVLLSYVPGFPILFLHMVRQRKRALAVNQ